MAIGTYMGIGGVKDLKSFYVGAGGVKSGKSIYIGQNGSPSLVWPPYIYDNGEFSPLGNGMSFNYDESIGAYPQVRNESSYIQIYGTSSGYSSYTASMVGCFTNEAIDMTPYKTLTVYYYSPSLYYSSSSTVLRFYIGGCTSKPYFGNTSNSRFYTNGTVYQSDTVYINQSMTANTTYTLSMDVSSRTNSLYVYIGHDTASASIPARIDLRITRLELTA